MMHVTYKNSFRDILVGYLYLLTRTPLAIAFHIFIIVIISFSVLRNRSFGSVADIIGAIIACLFILFITYAGLFTLVTIFSAIIVRSSKKELLASRTVTIGENHLKAEAAYGQSEVDWSAVHKVVRTKKHILLILAGYSAHIIPRRAFSTDTEWDAFYQFCQKKIEPS